MEAAFSLRPREVFEELRKTVVGQDDAIRELSVALVKHLVGHPAPNIAGRGGRPPGTTRVPPVALSCVPPARPITQLACVPPARRPASEARK